MAEMREESDPGPGALAVVAAASLAVAPETAILQIGLPDLPIHVRRDALTSFFLFCKAIAAFDVT